MSSPHDRSKRPKSRSPSFWEAAAAFRRPNLTIEFKRPRSSEGIGGSTPSEIRASWQPAIHSHRKHINDQIDVLRGRLAGLPCLQVLATLVVTTMTHDPESYRESESRYSALHAEYATWLYLTSDPQPDLLAPILRAEDFQDVLDLLGEVIEAIRAYYLIQAQLARLAPDTTEEEVRMRARLWHLFVRSPAHAHHNRKQLTDLFGPFSAAIHDAVGFDVEQALQIDLAVGKLVNERLNTRLEEMADLVNRWHQSMRDPAAKAKLDRVERRVVSRFLKAPDPEQAAIAAAFAWTQSTWHEAFLVTPTDVSAQTGLPIEVVRAFLVQFGIGFGQKPQPDQWPSVQDQLERRPLVDLGQDTWFAALFAKVPWAIAPAIEQALRGSAQWERYQGHRSRYLERRAVDLIAGGSPSVQRWTRLKYGDGASGRPDLDGLVLVGGIAVLVETKGGRMSSAGRRGAPSGLREDLHDLLSAPQRQLNRATEYILGRPEAVFETSEGSVIVKRAELHRLAHIIVTGDSLTAFVTRLPRLAALGVFDDRSLPWAVDVIDLEVCTDILGEPNRLVHYIDRRMRAAHRGVEAPEELDFLGQYITHGLYFDEIDPEVDAILLTSHTEALDDYYRYQSGERSTPAPKPSLRIHPVLQDLIGRLETSAPAGYGEATFWIFELSAKGQASLAEMIEGRRQRALAGYFSAARMFLGDVVFAYMAVPEDDVGAPEGYLAAAKYLGRKDRAVGIAESARHPERIAVSVQYERWTRDLKTERWATKLMGSFDSRPS